MLVSGSLLGPNSASRCLASSSVKPSGLACRKRGFKKCDRSIRHKLPPMHSSANWPLYLPQSLMINSIAAAGTSMSAQGLACLWFACPYQNGAGSFSYVQEVQCFQDGHLGKVHLLLLLLLAGPIAGCSLVIGFLCTDRGEGSNAITQSLVTLSATWRSHLSATVFHRHFSLESRQQQVGQEAMLVPKHWRSRDTSTACCSSSQANTDRFHCREVCRLHADSNQPAATNLVTGQSAQ